MKDKQHVPLFRAKVGAENGWLTKSFIGLMSLKSGQVTCVFLSYQIEPTLFVSLPSFFAPSLFLRLDFLSHGSFSTPISQSLIRLAIFCLDYILYRPLPTFLWFFGIVGMLYLLDYLTLGIQARHSYNVAVLRVTEASFGRFRHTLKVIVEKDFLSEKEELQLKAPFPKMHNTLLTDRYIRGLRTKDLVSHKTLRGLVLLLMAAFVYMPIQVTHAASPTSSLDGLGVPIGPDSQALLQLGVMM
ncbi:MAG TPA: hypothetical protein VJL56_04275 [Candidatus Bathyarchaeia archaeon]|nr:MAG: hypothetical protein AUF79_03045 [Crenarchaeota archaeon 13_1_20CM_2_51_8]HLC11044.1 hypothetical protein [Candidatus Bathyarchaeia archaeon]